LDLLGFIRPNRDFSKGYERKNKKKSTRVSGCMQNVSDGVPLLSPGRCLGAAPGLAVEFVMLRIITHDSDLRKKMSPFF
jgi:hypothetical protein